MPLIWLVDPEKLTVTVMASGQSQIGSRTGDTSTPAMFCLASACRSTEIFA